ncbi:MAG: DUF58 domain-containing protein [Chloroflexota bacterium]
MKRPLRVLLIFLGLSLLGVIFTGSKLYYRLSYLWGFLLVGNWIWAAVSLRGVNLKRSTRTRRAQVGDIFTERFELHNSGRLSRLWLEVQDEAQLPGRQGSRVLTLVGGRQRRSYLARTRLTRRGVFQLGPSNLVSGDPFGLFTVIREIPSEQTLLVYPMLVPVRYFPSPAGMLPGGEALRRRTHQITPNAVSIREYLPGDPLNRIHWMSTARKSRIMVKEFELDPLAEVWLFIDAARMVQASKCVDEDKRSTPLWLPTETFRLHPSTEEYAVTIGASLARYFLSRRRAVGLVSIGQTLTLLSPDRGARQLNKFLEALALLRAEGELPLSALLLTQAQHIPRGSTVILITADNRQEVAEGVDHLLRRGLRPVVVLLDAESFGGAAGAERLQATLQYIGVPVFFVREGDDLEAVLNGSRMEVQVYPMRGLEW